MTTMSGRMEAGSLKRLIAMMKNDVIWSQIHGLVGQKYQVRLGSELKETSLSVDHNGCVSCSVGERPRQISPSIVHLLIT